MAVIVFLDGLLCAVDIQRVASLFANVMQTLRNYAGEAHHNKSCGGYDNIEATVFSYIARISRIEIYISTRFTCPSDNAVLNN